MRQLLLGIFFIFFGMPITAQNTISVGVDLSSNSISSNYELYENTAIAFDIGFILSKKYSLILNPQIQFQKQNNSYELEEIGTTIPYHGPSFVLMFNHSNNLYAVEYIWGVELELYEFPIELYVDAGPSFQLTEESNAFTLTSSFGIRYKL